MIKCNYCEKTVTTEYDKEQHKREKHTFINKVQVECAFCIKTFYKPIKRVCKKCEECRELQKWLETRDLESDTYVYKGVEQLHR